MELELVQTLTTTFESHAQQTDNGVEYWLARDIQHLLGYNEWRNFTFVLAKAKTACEVSGHPATDHFVDVNKMVDLGSGSQRTIDDIMLTRYACYLVAQNGDPRKPDRVSHEDTKTRRTIHSLHSFVPSCLRAKYLPSLPFLRDNPCFILHETVVFARLKALPNTAQGNALGLVKKKNKALKGRSNLTRFDRPYRALTFYSFHTRGVAPGCIEQGFQPSAETPVFWSAGAQCNAAPAFGKHGVYRDLTCLKRELRCAALPHSKNVSIKTPVSTDVLVYAETAVFTETPVSRNQGKALKSHSTGQRPVSTSPRSKALKGRHPIPHSAFDPALSGLCVFPSSVGRCPTLKDSRLPAFHRHARYFIILPTKSKLYYQ